MLHTLYLLCIAPLEFLMRLVLEWGFSLTHSWGWSLVLLSLAVNTAILPIYNWAERRQEEERRLRRSMARHEAMLRECFRGQERFALLSAFRRVGGYHWSLALRSSVGLLVQIPFFIAAWHLLSAWTPFSGRGFGLLADLSAPDRLVRLGDVEINILPFVMTAANLLAVFVHARGLARRDKAQLCGIALLFLVLLYPAASALVLYWTLNNVYVLGRNMLRPGRFTARSAPGVGRPLDARWAGFAAQIETEGTWGHQAARLLRAAIPCFGAGCLFWLWTCAFALDRQNPSGGGFMLAIWRSGGQCLLTAFLASLVLGMTRRSGSRRTPLFFAGAILLFALQLAFGDRRFPPDLWNGRGALVFALWASAICCLDRFRGGLAVFGERGKRFGRGTAGAGQERPEAEALPFLSRRDSFTLACLTGTVCGLFLWYFIPFATYFRNTNEFDFNGWELFGKVTPCCLLTILVSSLLFFVTASFLPAECVRLPWKRGGATGGKVNVAHTFLAALLLAALIEGTLLSYELPQLAGEAELFDSKYRLLIDALIWFDFLLIGTWYWRRMARHVPVLLAVLALFSCTSLLDFYRTADDKIDGRKFKGVNGLRMLDRESFFPELRFSDADNIIILLVDSLDTLSFEKTLETYPDLKSILDGFWVFRENLGPGGLTFCALPQILSGKIHKDAKFGSEFVREALVGEQGMAADALRHGRKAFIDANFWQVVTGEARMDADRLRRANISLHDYLRVFSFRFFPYWGKRLALGWVNYINQEADAHMTPGDDINQRTFNKVIKRMNARCEEGVLQFIYFFGVHLPFIKEDIIETTHAFILDFSTFLDALKTFGLHDKSTLVVMADHGLYAKDYRHWYPERHGAQPTALFPLLMVKTPESSGELIFREDLTSSVHIRELVREFYEKGASNGVMAAWLAGLPAVRHVYKENVGRFEARGDFASLVLKKAEGKGDDRLAR